MQQPRERCCWTKATRSEQTRNQPAWKTIPKKTWCRCAAALTMGYQLNHVWKNQKLFRRPNQTHFRIDGLFTLKKELLPKNLLLKKVLGRTICELTDKTPSLRLGKVTLPRGKLECRSYVLRPRETKYLLWTLVQCCPEGRVAVSGAGAGRTY